MFRMEIDSPPSDDVEHVSPKDCITQRLEVQGVPTEYLEKLQPGLVVYYKENRSKLPGIVSAILPTDEADDMDVIYFQESMVWLQWLMFEKDPEPVLKNLVELSAGQRGVCGAVWGNNDIAYRCRTCEHDPTCAICVPCFQNGNHKDHDYSIIYTGGGCCDCGDVTAWKSNGFCSKHKGAEQIQHLSEELAKSIGPVLDLLFSYWKSSLTVAESVYLRSPRADDHADDKKVSDGLATAVVEMLLEFCNCSESLLSFISARLLSSVGLLNILVRAERFLCEEDVTKLQGLLLKMLSEPLFKYEFAKVFLNYYPTVVSEAIKGCDDDVYKKYPLLSTFSVQIFTVPTLTPRLVKERDLLVLLLKCLANIFVSCAGEDGRLKVSKWLRLYETTLRVVEDVRFVLSHAVVPKYVTHDRRDIVKMWMELLAFMQGMNPHKRETGTHIEEENDNVHLPFVLGHTVANIHSLLVAGVFSERSVDENLFNTSKSYHDDRDSPRHAKVGRHSEESSVSSRNNILSSTSGDANIKSDFLLSQPAVSCLTNECLKAIESWLTSPTKANMLGNKIFALKKILSNSSKLTSISELQGTRHSSSVQNEDTGSHVGTDMEIERVIEQGAGSGGLQENAMETEITTEIEALRVLSLSDWPEIPYDVSSMDISVHIPLLRLLSMILQRAAKKCYGELSSPKTVSFSSFDTSSAVSQDFFGNVLSGFHPHGFSAFIMEHPLRIRVFCAQVHAGMWKKNGEVAILSWTWYRSVNWSEQGLELDLFLLQCCAALAPADLYVSRLLERFGLSNYLLLDIQRFNEYEPVLMQEMLVLIIQIIKERRFCGLSTTACLQRELIRKLAIGNATHSQLVKSLPRDLSKNNRLQEILDKVAVYTNPSGMKQGMYKLRLEFWKQLDLYHPRWDLKELQIAEERYLHSCQASLLSSQLPKWTNIYEPFIGIARIATCKMVLQIIGSVLFYSVKTNNSVPSRAPDSLLLTALHLLSLALDICSQEKESSNLSGSVGNSFPILAFAGEDLFVNHADESCDESLLSLLVASMRMHKRERPENFSEAGNFNISSLIQSLLKKMAELDSGCMTKMQKLAPEVVNTLSHSSVNSGLVTEADKRKAKAREKQAAIMEKMRAQQSKFLESVDSSAKDESEGSKGGEASTSDGGIDTEESTQDVCSLCHDSKSNSPRCFLILLQKSMLQSLVDRDPPSWKDISSDKEKFSEMSPLPDRKISTSNSGQNSPQFNQLIQSAINEFASDGHPRELNAFVEFIKSRFPSVRNILLPSTSGKASEKTAASLETLEEHIYLTTCEQMRHNLELDHKFPMVNESPKTEVVESLLLGKYIATLSKETFENILPSESSRTRTELLESSRTLSGLVPVDCDGVHVSSCGHAVHQACLDRYLLSVKKRYFTHVAIEGRPTADPDQGEFLCPVCRGIANSVLPALPRNSTMIGSASTSCSVSENKEFRNLFLREAFSLLNSAADVVGRNEILQVFPTDQIGRTSPNHESVFRVLSGMYFPENQDKALGSERVTHSMIMWDTLKYSLISAEIASRCKRSSLSPNFTTDALFKELKSSKGFILSLLLKNVLSMRNKNSLSVLLRLRGIQLFAESVCSGTSVDDFATHSLKQRAGNMSSILKKLGREVPYPDIEFWKQASNPILSSDAFSSLMWLLFCLPSQIISCKDSFMSLVHLFYGVSVVQAVITYFGKYQCNMSELGCNGVLITEIFNIIQECGVAKQYFFSNHLDHSFDIKSSIRGLSFPFLRRCGLLWKVINASTSAPFGDGARLWDSIPSHANNDKIEDVNSNTVEPAQVEALEMMFKIPPLEIVLSDEVLCSVVSRWLRHFNKEFQARYAHTVLPMTPAVPFKLMQLPNVYQDLLQRYIKQQCANCNSAMEEPALCLLCGKLCTPTWRPCCSESDCQTHATVCGAGIGVFLLVRKTTILLHRVARMASWPSPYLDAYGEEDLEMQRGKPLYLNEERYAFLAYMVAFHGFDRISKHFRQITLGA